MENSSTALLKNMAILADFLAEEHWQDTAFYHRPGFKPAQRQAMTVAKEMNRQRSVEMEAVRAAC